MGCNCGKKSSGSSNNSIKKIVKPSPNSGASSIGNKSTNTKTIRRIIRRATR
jgi:hypothetical protein